MRLPLAFVLAACFLAATALAGAPAHDAWPATQADDPAEAAAAGPASGVAGRQAQVDRLAAAMKPGEWRELESEGYDRQTLMRGDDILAYAGRAAWDPGSRRVLFVGQVHLKGPPVFISYAADDNRWRREPKPPWAENVKWFHAYENNAVDASRGVFYHHQSDTRLVHRYDVAKGEWSALPELPDAPTGHGTAVEHFPEREGLVRVLGGTVWFWSDRDKAWSRLAEGLDMGPYHNFASYSPAAKVVLFGGGNGSRAVYALDRDGKIAARADAPVEMGIGRSLSVADPASGELLVLAKGGTFHAYDPAADRWRDLPAGGLPFRGYGGHSVSAAPLGGGGVVLFFSSEPQGMKAFLYKHARRDE